MAKEGERFEASVRHLARSAGLYWGVFGLYKGRELARKRKLSPLAAPPPSTNRILYLLVKILPRRSGGAFLMLGSTLETLRSGFGRFRDLLATVALLELGFGNALVGALDVDLDGVL